MPGKKGAQKAAKIGNKKGKKSGKGPAAKPAKPAPKYSKQAPKVEEDLDADLAKQAAVIRKTKAHRLNEAQARADSKVDAEPRESRGVVYLGHIPKGFAEPQMKTFFGQFGQVTRLRLSRSKTNAAPKGYAFIEFAEESVAQIVAETMNKYLLFDKVLVANLVPKDKQHPSLFKGSSRMFINMKPKRLRNARSDYNDRPTVEVNGVQVPQQTLNQVKKQKLKSKQLKEKLALLGIQFNPDAAIAGGSDEPEEEAPKETLAGGKKKRRIEQELQSSTKAAGLSAPAAKKKKQA